MKNYKISGDKIIKLIEPMGGCFATNAITVDGLPVTYMYRESPLDDMDSGWRFFSGTESQDYVDDPNNTDIYNVNTIANYDSSIIPYLNYPEGTELEKDDDEKFRLIPG